MATKKTKKSTDVNLLDGFRTYATKVRMFFGSASDIAIDIDINKRTVNLVIPDATKAACVAAIINPKPIDMETSPILINGTPLANATKASISEKTIKIAIGNIFYFSQIKKGDMFSFVMVIPDAVALYNESIYSPWGYSTISVEQLAQEVLDLGGNFHVCSDWTRRSY